MTVTMEQQMDGMAHHHRPPVRRTIPGWRLLTSVAVMTAGILLGSGISAADVPAASPNPTPHNRANTHRTGRPRRPIPVTALRHHRLPDRLTRFSRSESRVICAAIHAHLCEVQERAVLAPAHHDLETDAGAATRVKDQLKRRLHEPIPVQGRWLRSVLQCRHAR